MASPFANIHVSPEMIPHRHNLPREKTLYHNDIFCNQSYAMAPVLLRDDGTVWGPDTLTSNHICQYGITDVIDIIVYRFSDSAIRIFCLRNDGNVYVNAQVKKTQTPVATTFYGPNFTQFYRIPELTNVIALSKQLDASGGFFVFFADESVGHAVISNLTLYLTIRDDLNVSDAYDIKQTTVLLQEDGTMYAVSYASSLDLPQYYTGHCTDTSVSSYAVDILSSSSSPYSLNCDLDIIQVVAASTCAAYLSRNGKVYVCRGTSSDINVPGGSSGTTIVNHVNISAPFQELSVPSGKFVISISASCDHIFIICSDGTTYATGANSTWTQITDLSNIVKIIGTQYAWYAITGDGTVWTKATTLGNNSSYYYSLGRGANPSNATEWYPIVIDYRDIKVPYGDNNFMSSKDGVTAKGNYTGGLTSSGKKLSWVSSRYLVTRDGELYVSGGTTSYVNTSDQITIDTNVYSRHKTLSGVKMVGYGGRDITAGLCGTVILFNGDSYTLTVTGAATKTARTRIVSTSCTSYDGDSSSSTTLYTLTDADGKVWSHASNFGLINGSSTSITEAAYCVATKDAYGKIQYYYVKYNGDIYVAGSNNPDNAGENRCGIIDNTSTSISTPVFHSNIKDTKDIGTNGYQ